MCKLLLTAGLCLIIARLASCSRLVCYYNSSAENRDGNGRLTISDIDANKCTHLIFAFADISSNALVPKMDSDKDLYESFNALKTINPQLKTLLAVGDTPNFSSMVDTPSSRLTFVQSAITLLRTHGFDGLSVDWWFPDNKRKFTRLLRNLRNRFRREATQSSRDRLLLIASVSAEKDVIDDSYEVSTISGFLDFINVLTFDFRGPSETVAGHHSPLFRGSQDTGDKANSNTDFALQYWKDQGAPEDKLLLGIASFGRVYALTSEASGVGAPVSGYGTEGTFTKIPGLLAYYEICDTIGNTPVNLIADQKVPFATVGDQWIGFDHITSVEEKVNYVNTNNLGGVFVWSLDLDDFNGQFCKRGKSPLITRLSHLLFPDPTLSDNFCVGKSSGIHVNPYEPRTFFSCVHGITYSLNCPANLVFNPHCTCCDYPYSLGP